MEVILLETVQHLGATGDLVEVKNGYARNYLIPNKKAIQATAEAKERAEDLRRKRAEEERKTLADARNRADHCAREITLSRLCTEEGHLYGSVTQKDVSEALSEASIPVDRSEILLPDGPVKEVGSFEATVQFHPEVQFTIQLEVIEESSDEKRTEEPQ